MDESRKAFERWWEVNCHNGQPPRHGWDFWRDGEGYSIEDDEEFQWRWEAWQASRAAIEIELPEACSCCYSESEKELHDAAMSEVADILSAAGIKVKE
ncbi:hypothetical protein [Enterobacter sp. 18A13]|uniref:hypothetical protein n=1 Tax=Enterobacter sp. 18A13 TaxID=2565914 RepID=UPI0010CA3C05|nr:hypothetical protein [Enterobacter sp. 18A13]BBJ66300.1 hypothetical protein ECC18A13_008650 [Enterobacter sp. 18A13]